MSNVVKLAWIPTFVGMTLWEALGAIIKQRHAPR